jgi:hypothetical protein
MIYNPLIFKASPRQERMFFNVHETPVKYDDPEQEGVMRYYPNRKVIINLNLNEGISLVRSNFLAVEHGDAFQLGQQLFEMLFGVTPQVHKEWMSPSTTDYYVDLISESSRFVLDYNGFRYSSAQKRGVDIDLMSMPPHLVEFDAPPAWRRPQWIKRDFKDAYRPFLRVSNYLRDNNSMVIEMGFYRDRCTNGMLLGMRSKTIFKQSYVVNSFEQITQNAFQFFEKHNKYMFNSMERLWKLLVMPISIDDMHLITYDIYEEEMSRKSFGERQHLRRVIKDLVKGYSDEIGENMNAALNVATDLSKRLETGRSSQSRMQRRAAHWMHKVTSGSFKMESYLRSLAGIEERVLMARLEQEDEFMEDENE